MLASIFFTKTDNSFLFKLLWHTTLTPTFTFCAMLLTVIFEVFVLAVTYYNITKGCQMI